MKHLYKFSLLLLAFLLPAIAAAHDIEVDGIYYNINGDEATVTFSPNYNYSGDVIIPATVTYNGTTYSVTSIGDRAFGWCKSLTSVTIPNSVTSIGEGAFNGCSGLSSIDIPNSVTSIGREAFFGTPWFDNQPDGLVYVGLVAYKYKGTMSSGTSITLAEGTLGIAGDAFSYCPSLTSITIGNSVTSIGNNAFFGCSSLTDVTIPTSVTSIGDGAFSGCSSLTRIMVASGNPTYDSRNNCNAIIETASNTLIAGCMNTVIPNSVTFIGDWSFYGCSSLASIDIPNSVTSIGNYAFYDCTGLTSVTIGNSVNSIGMDAFYIWENSSMTRVNISDIAAWCNIEFEGREANPLYCCGHLYLNGSEITELDIPNSVTSINDYAFGFCFSLTSVTIPNSVTTVI